MEFLAEIDDALLGIEITGHQVSRDAYKIRHAARAVILNDKGKIALLHARHRGYHKLPGGGIETGEDWHRALEREALEEVGCSIDVMPAQLGRILEWRARFNLKQISICGIGRVKGVIGPLNLTEDEIAVGLSVKWVTPEEAMNLLAMDQPDDYEGCFIKMRDTLFLQKAQSSGYLA